MSDVFAVLADPTRRRMLEVMRAGERSVGELVAAVDIEQPGVSRHLRILREAGLVTVRPQGQRRLYSLQPEPLHELDDWLSEYRALWDARFDRLARHIAKRREETDDDDRN